MNMISDTPETNAAEYYIRQEGHYVRADFARKLERERDEARRDLSTVIFEILKKDGVSVFDVSAMDRLAELHRNERGGK